MAATRPIKSDTIIRDTIVLVIACICFGSVAWDLDLLERIYDFSREHENLELDEWLPMIAFLGLCLIVFNFRRWQENHRLSSRLVVRNHELDKALAEIKTLRGIVPICSHCKKIRDDQGYWQQVDAYVETHSEALFSHSLCPDCLESSYGDESWFQKMKEEG